MAISYLFAVPIAGDIFSMKAAIKQFFNHLIFSFAVPKIMGNFKITEFNP